MDLGHVLRDLRTEPEEDREGCWRDRRTNHLGPHGVLTYAYALETDVPANPRGNLYAAAPKSCATD